MDKTALKSIVAEGFNVLEGAAKGRFIVLFALHTVEAMVLGAIDSGLFDGLIQTAAEDLAKK
jgi:hypothetical protein